MKENRKTKLIPSVRAEIRQKGYSYSTEKNYVNWVLRYIRFHNLQHPKDLSGKHINEFLSSLAVQG